MSVCVYGYVYANADATDGFPWSCSYRQLQAGQNGCLEQNSGPLQEEYALLTAEPSLHPQL